MRAVLLALAATILSGCDDLIFDTPSERTPAEVYEELWTVFSEGYAPFAERAVDWAEVGALHRPQADATEDDLFASATALLAELDDGHVTLAAPDRPFFVAKRSFRENTYQLHLDLGIVFREFTEGPFTEGSARFGVLPGDIGYMHIESWSDPLEDLDGLMDFMRDRAAVIVDLRHNPGGDFTNGFPLAARFAEARRLAFTTFTKTGPGPNDLGDGVEWFIEPEGPFQFVRPVAVLVNGFTNSAAERTLMAFRTMPHVTVVGSRTAGNHGEKVGGQLSNGWGYSIVPQVVRTFEGVSFEGPGLPVDIEADNSAEEVAAGVDRQLNAALAALTGGS